MEMTLIIISGILILCLSYLVYDLYSKLKSVVDLLKRTTYLVDQLSINAEETTKALERLMDCVKIIAERN